MSDPQTIVRSLEEITNRIAGGQDLDAALGGIVSALTEVLRAERCSILLKTAPDCLRIRAARGIPPRIIEETVVRLGEGIAGRVAATGRAELLHDVHSASNGARRDGYASSSAICAPLRLRGEVLGVINVNDRRAANGDGFDEFDEEDLLLVTLLANQGAMALEAARSIETAREHERLKQTTARLEREVGALQTQVAALDVIRQVTDLITSSKDLDTVLHGIVQSTTALLGATRGSLMLLDTATDLLRMRAAVGIPDAVVCDARATLGSGIAGGVALRGEPVLIEDIAQAAPAPPRPERCAQYRNPSALCVPVKIRGDVLGVLNINDPADDRAFTPSDLFVAEVIANQAAVAIADSRLLADSIRAAETRRALELAREIQRSFLPDEPGVPGYRVACRSEACDAAGGDYIDCAPRTNGTGLPSGELFVAIGDVAGRGVGAALLMATSRAFLRALLVQGGDLAALFLQLNRLILADFRRGQFLTLFAGVADPARGVLTYTSAGHDPPLVHRHATGALEQLEATGPPLGVTPDAAFPTATTALAPGDLVVLTTDGIWEVSDEAGERFGRERLKQAIRAAAALHPEDVVDEIWRRIAAFRGTAASRDDLSLAVVRVERCVT